MEPTLKYKLPDNVLNLLTNATNRATSQTQELFDLCGGDFARLFDLEERLKNLHMGYCPSTKEEVEHVMELPFDREKQWWFLKFTVEYKV